MLGGGGSGPALRALQQGPTATRPTYRLIQVLRAVAALLVVAHHALLAMHNRYHLPVLNWVQGGAGVDIFFVISGFVMTISSAPLRSAPHPARTFLARRLERIVPLYWLLTLLKVVLVQWDPSVSLNGWGGWHFVVASLLFLPALSPQHTLEPMLVVGWTLNLEMLFYFVFGMPMAWRIRPWKIVLPALAVLSLIAFARIAALSGNIRFYANPLVLEFGYGVLLATAVHQARRLPWPLAVAFLLVGFWCLTQWTWPNFSALRFLGWGLPALAIVWAAIALEDRIGRPVPGWLLELGDASYSLYLVHGFVVAGLSVGIVTLLAHRSHGLTLVFAILMVLSVVAGELLYRFVELPMLRYFRGRRRPATPANT